MNKAYMSYISRLYQFDKTQYKFPSRINILLNYDSAI